MRVSNLQGSETILDTSRAGDITKWNSSSTGRVAHGVGWEAFVGDSRLIPARTPNLPSRRRTSNLGSGPWNYVVDLAEPGPNCVRESKSFRQADCPDANSHGFIFDTPYSDPSSWPDLDQTKVLVMHSWIAEYANIRRIVEESDGRKRVMFQA